MSLLDLRFSSSPEDLQQIISDPRYVVGKKIAVITEDPDDPDAFCFIDIRNLQNSLQRHERRRTPDYQVLPQIFQADAGIIRRKKKIKKLIGLLGIE